MKAKIGNHLFLLKHRKLQHGVVGVRSDCCMRRHVFFCEADAANPLWLDKRIREMQRRFDMGTVYLLKSSEGNYHMMEFTMRTFGEVMDIQDWFGADFTRKYMVFAAVRGYWVLRCSPKVGKGQPELVCKYARIPVKKRECCGSHWNWFITHYGLDDIRSGELHEVKFDQYPTVEKKETEFD